MTAQDRERLERLRSLMADEISVAMFLLKIINEQDVEIERLKAPYNSVWECELCQALNRVTIERPVRVEK